LTRPTDRKDALLADRALEGLSEAEARELEQLGGAGDDAFDLAAAAVALAELGPLEPMPELLAARVRAGARTGARERPRRDLGRSAGWLAAAAAVLLAVFAWSRPPQVVEKIVKVEVPAPPARLPTPAERRAELLAQAADARTLPWSATPDPAAREATGDVVWSESRQQGYLRIRGLAVNDPSRAQYQLWIFDARRDQAHPVDGGVFDVQGGDVIVPIHAAIRVFEPRLFAVTVERPGGVVVSKRERIVLTATM
jgi:hypothetical protein